MAFMTVFYVKKNHPVFSVEDWVSEEEPENPAYQTDQFDTSEIFLYKVL